MGSGKGRGLALALMWVWCTWLLAGCGNTIWFFDEPSDSSTSVPDKADVLFVIDDSPSMVAEQEDLARAIPDMGATLAQGFEPGDINLAVLTTTMTSAACPGCDPANDDTCLDPAGEDGRFSDRIGHVTWHDGLPRYSFAREPGCRVVTGADMRCLYDPIRDRGTLLAGDGGCGLRRPLAALRRALQPDLLEGANAGFLRREATLIVVVLSDGEDCGEVGEVAESPEGFDPAVCYQAAAGPGALTPERDYLEFLLDLKNYRLGSVKLVGITGVADPADPLATGIEFEGGAVRPVCERTGCVADDCRAGPGTRIIQMASLLGLGRDGMLDTICQGDLGTTLERAGRFGACPTAFFLEEPIHNPDLADIQVNHSHVPPYSCSFSEDLQSCHGPGDTACYPANCVRTWNYHPPVGDDPPAPGGAITFADHYNPCVRFADVDIKIRVFDPVE